MVQECTPENLEMKKQVFAQLSKYAEEGAIIASSTSCLMPSLFTEHLSNRSHCIVAHPVRGFQYPIVATFLFSSTLSFYNEGGKRSF